MTKKIPVKNLYLIAIISIGLIGLAVGSTYAMFTATAEINNPISLSSNLTYTSDIVETMDVTVAAGETEYVTLDITNSTDSTLNYAIWYIDDSGDCDFGTEFEDGGYSTSGSIASSEFFSVDVYIRNNSTSNVTVTLGISSSVGNIVLADNMTILPNSGLPVPKNLLKRIEYLYTNATKTTVTNNSITYNYATSVNLMEDTAGNIRYYGASPNNYIYFNCDAYPNTNCELWRIIGIVDGKVKLIRNTSIGYYSWDVELSNEMPVANDWSQADLMKLLNPGYENESIGGSLYYNSESGTCYRMDFPDDATSTISCDFTSTGLSSASKNIIDTSIWYLGGHSSTVIYPNQIYNFERGTNVWSDGRPTSWLGKVALPYPSDYGYAADLALCNKTLNNYDSSTCNNNNWMSSVNNRAWLLTPDSAGPFDIWYIRDGVEPGFSDTGGGLNISFNVNPTLYLSSNIVIESGSGTEGDPYRISA